MGRDFEKGNKLLRKMSAFGETEDIEKAKQRLEMEQKAQEVTARALRESAKHFVNYNKVESFFMICSIVVCLSGIMFASGYFNMEYLQSQKRILGVTNMTIVVYSLSFFFYVIGMEITAVKKFRQSKNKAKWQAFQKKAASKIEATFKGRQARKAL